MAPNPGTKEAIKQGYTCPVLDNAHGRGYMGGIQDDEGEIIYVYAYKCPVHWTHECLFKGKKNG